MISLLNKIPFLKIFAPCRSVILYTETPDSDIRRYVGHPESTRVETAKSLFILYPDAEIVGDHLTREF